MRQIKALLLLTDVMLKKLERNSTTVTVRATKFL